MKVVIFTDLDGTLLDPVTYSWEAARPALNLIKQKAIPLIFCSSKTRAEIEVIRAKIGNYDPFITENGGAIFIPEHYFAFSFPFNKKIADDRAIELGKPYMELRQAIQAVSQKSGVPLRGYGDLSPEEIAAQTGLSVEEARLAKQREYDEPFILTGNDEEKSRILRLIEQQGLTWTRGSRYHHLMGDNDKGRAVKILIGLFRQQWGTVTTIAIGDSPNDLPMLQAVDHPVLVQKAGGRYDEKVALPNLQRANGIGPIGWNEAVLELLESLPKDI
jgi:mannosyl-3-phosphoglycerate phosphatase